jgi:hypothetical protein
MKVDSHWSKSPSKLESEGGVQPSILTLGRFIEVTEDEWQARVEVPDAWGACIMYSAGIELKMKTIKLFLSLLQVE